jgi:hypothetical protein
VLELVLRNDSTKSRITVLTGQLVGKVNLGLDSTEKDGPEYKAKGVEFGTHRKEGWSFNVTAKEEVLLAAGSTISPLILQYSGIGPADVLANPKVKIEQKIDLPICRIKPQPLSSPGPRRKAMGRVKSRTLQPLRRY